MLFFLMPAAASNVSHQPITSHVSARACAVYTLSFGMDPQSFDKGRAWAEKSCSHPMLRLMQMLELFLDCSKLYHVPSTCCCDDAACLTVGRCLVYCQAAYILKNP